MVLGLILGLSLTHIMGEMSFNQFKIWETIYNHICCILESWQHIICGESQAKELLRRAPMAPQSRASLGTSEHYQATLMLREPPQAPEWAEAE